MRIPNAIKFGATLCGAKVQIILCKTTHKYLRKCAKKGKTRACEQYRADISERILLRYQIEHAQNGQQQQAQAKPGREPAYEFFLYALT